MTLPTTLAIRATPAVDPTQTLEDDRAIPGLPNELFQTIISRLDQMSKFNALGVSRAWKANVIAEVKHEKLIVENVVQYIVENLDSTKHSAIITEVNSCLAKNPIFRPVFLCSSSPGAQSRNAWFFHIRWALAFYLSSLSEDELKQLQVTFNSRRESYFGALPELALLYKKIHANNNAHDQQKLYSMHAILRDEFPKKGYFDEAISIAMGLNNNLSAFPLMRAAVLDDLANALTEAGYLDKALTVAKMVTDNVPNLPNGAPDEENPYDEALEYQIKTINRIAWSHQKMAEKCKLSAAKAFEIACMFPPGSDNDHLFYWIGLACMDQQNFVGAFVCFEKIQSTSRSDDGKYKLAIRLFDGGDREGSVAVIKTMDKDDTSKASAIMYNTRALFKENDLAGAVNAGCLLKYTTIALEDTSISSGRIVAYFLHEIMAALLDNKDTVNAWRLYQVMPNDGPNGYLSCTIRDINLVEMGELRRCHPSNPAKWKK